MQKKKHVWKWSCFMIGIAACYLCYTGFQLVSDRIRSRQKWEEYRTAGEEMPEQYAGKGNPSAVDVFGSVYVKSIDSIDIRNSEFSVSFEALFCWDKEKYPDFTMEDNFQIYNGKFTENLLLDEYDREEMRCQLFYLKGSVKEVFSTKRFPLSAYQLRFYLQPKKDMGGIHLRRLEEGYVGADDQLNVAGFRMEEIDVSDFYYEVPLPTRYGSYEGEEVPVVYSELLTSIELSRASWGLYFKCIIALIGSGIWVFFCFFICIYDRLDNIGVISPVFFGVVTNLLVGANLVPDALETGLLEYINIWGIYTILSVTFMIIYVNRIRYFWKEEAYARYFGKVMFCEMAAMTVLGHLVIPLCAYLK